MNELELCRKEIDAIDKEMARLYEERMKIVSRVAEYKIKNGMPVLDQKREGEIIERRTREMQNQSLAFYYRTFLEGVMKSSRAFQGDLIANQSKHPVLLSVSHDSGEYPIVLGKGLLPHAGEYFPLDRKVLVVTDTGVPSLYAEVLAAQCQTPVVVILPMGEESKSLSKFEHLLSVMQQNGFTRGDAVVAVGGGVVGDLSGFAASAYMRGIDFYNIPTTLLSQLDSSIGGKVAVDFEGAKNTVGAFYPPKGVLIDPDVLNTLDNRQFSAGLMEAIKMALTSSEALFWRIANSPSIREDIEGVILEALKIKKSVVEQDPKEQNLRRVLNFGHTVGHAIESEAGGTLLHGECVGMGMLPMCAEGVKEALLPVLQKYGLPPIPAFTKENLLQWMKHDKKAKGKRITVVYVPRIGEFSFISATESDLMGYLEKLL